MHPEPALNDYIQIFFYVMLLLCLGMLLIRFLRGPTSLDRLAALESFTILFLSLIGLWGLIVGSEWFMDVVLVISLIGFLSTVTVAKFIERGRISHD